LRGDVVLPRGGKTPPTVGKWEERGGSITTLSAENWDKVANAPARSPPLVITSSRGSTKTDIVVACTPLKLGNKKTREQQDRQLLLYKKKGCCFFWQQLANPRSWTFNDVIQPRPSFLLF